MNITIKSARRVFEILETFASERLPRRATWFARRLRYPASSTVVLLKSMCRCGYLAFDIQSRTYFPTVRLVLLAVRLRRLTGDQSNAGDRLKAEIRSSAAACPRARAGK